MRNATVILIMILSTLGPSAVIGMVGFGAVKAIGRNPAASPRVLLAMIVAFLFAESIAVIAILLVFFLFR